MINFVLSENREITWEVNYDYLRISSINEEVLIYYDEIEETYYNKKYAFLISSGVKYEIEVESLISIYLKHLIEYINLKKLFILSKETNNTYITTIQMIDGIITYDVKLYNDKIVLQRQDEVLYDEFYKDINIKDITENEFKFTDKWGLPTVYAMDKVVSYFIKENICEQQNY